MLRKLTVVIAAGIGALSLFAGGAVHARDFPLSVDETGPVAVDHATAPTNASPPYASAAFEVQTPSSVSESAPWLTGERIVPGA